MLKQVEIFTDGSCLGNPGPGGYGAILRYKQHEKTLSAGYYLTTNNRMELMAAIVALETLKDPCSVILCSDSQYVRQGITQWIHNWKKRGWKTADKNRLKTWICGSALISLSNHTKLNGFGSKATQDISKTNAAMSLPAQRRVLQTEMTQAISQKANKRRQFVLLVRTLTKTFCCANGSTPARSLTSFA